jgi:hypothetical protein
MKQNGTSNIVPFRKEFLKIYYTSYNTIIYNFIVHDLAATPTSKLKYVTNP